MKKLLTLGLLSLLLSGCSLLGQDKKDSTTTAKSTTTSHTTSSSETQDETKSFRYEVKNGTNTQSHQHTLTYRDNKILTLRQQVTGQLFNDETMANLRQQSLAAVKPELLAVLEEHELTKNLRQTQGVTNLSFDVNENYDVITDISIDMTTADFTALANNSGFGLDLLELNHTSAKQYMARMKIRLAQEVSPQ